MFRMNFFIINNLIFTLTDCTAPNGPNSCHKTFSSVSGAKLYTKMHHPDPFMAFVGIIVLAKRSPANGEYLGREINPLVSEGKDLKK